MMSRDADKAVDAKEVLRRQRLLDAFQSAGIHEFAKPNGGQQRRTASEFDWYYLGS
jgi:hypothetical protein